MCLCLMSWVQQVHNAAVVLGESLSRVMQKLLEAPQY